MLLPLGTGPGHRHAARLGRGAQAGDKPVVRKGCVAGIGQDPVGLDDLERAGQPAERAITGQVEAFKGLKLAK